jgi:hypothetical protein
MSHFAEIKDGIVQRVIVAEQDFIDQLPGTWVQTSYHGSIRKNFAGIGYAYDAERDAFIAPQPFPSWVLDEKMCQWQAPVPMPTDGKIYRWDEIKQIWTVTGTVSPVA